MRSEVVVESLRELRARRTPPRVSVDGPPLHGSISLLAQPVYLSATQPDIGGAICNVRPSSRYEVVYAVYLVADWQPEVIAVVDGERSPARVCGWNGKVVILEIRSDEAPSVFCAERRGSERPLSEAEVRLVQSPSGVELVDAASFERDRCPGLEAHQAWGLSHSVRLRNTSPTSSDELSVWLVNEAGQAFVSRYPDWDVDPDVRQWWFAASGNGPFRLLVGTPIPEPSRDATRHLSCSAFDDDVYPDVAAATLGQAIGGLAM